MCYVNFELLGLVGFMPVLLVEIRMGCNKYLNTDPLIFVKRFAR